MICNRNILIEFVIPKPEKILQAMERDILLLVFTSFSRPKGYPFPLVGEFPKPPAQHRNVWAEHHAEHGGCRALADA